MKPNAFIDKYMTYESTSESEYHFYWADDQYNRDYATGFNLLEKNNMREKCRSTGH